MENTRWLWYVAAVLGLVVLYLWWTDPTRASVGGVAGASVGGVAGGYPVSTPGGGLAFPPAADTPNNKIPLPPPFHSSMPGAGAVVFPTSGPAVTARTGRGHF